MIKIIIISLIGSGFLTLESKSKVDYYYFTSDYCLACKEQTKIIKKLNKQGYDFKIKKSGYKKYQITVLPAIVVVIKEKNKPIVTVKMENRLWTRKELKILVTTVNFLT